MISEDAGAGLNYQDRYWSSGDGLTLYARDYAASSGEARLPVICLHGLTRNSRDFETLAPWIAAGGRRVIVPDMRGRGRSDRDPKPDRYTPPTYARDVLRLMDELGIARAIFIGTSMGGIITMMLAGVRLRAVAGAILNDVGPIVAPEGLARIKSYVGKNKMIDSWKDAIDYVRTINQAAFPDYQDADWEGLARRTFREEEGKPKFDYDPAIAAPIARSPSRALPVIAWLLFTRLARRRPTLLLRGELSDVLSRETAERMRKRAPKMEFRQVPGVGHAPMLDEPDSLEAISDFLSRQP